LPRPLQRRPQVVVLRLQAVQPHALLCALELLLRLLGKRQEPLQVLRADHSRLPGLEQPVSPILPHCQQHPVPRLIARAVSLAAKAPPHRPSALPPARASPTLPRDLSTSWDSRSSTPHDSMPSAAQTASAASSAHPPANTDRRRRSAFSGSESRSKLQSISARRVCWRGKAAR